MRKRDKFRDTSANEIQVMSFAHSANPRISELCFPGGGCNRASDPQIFENLLGTASNHEYSHVATKLLHDPALSFSGGAKARGKGQWTRTGRYAVIPPTRQIFVDSHGCRVLAPEYADVSGWLNWQDHGLTRPACTFIKAIRAPTDGCSTAPGVTLICQASSSSQAWQLSIARII